MRPNAAWPVDLPAPDPGNRCCQVGTVRAVRPAPTEEAAVAVSSPPTNAFHVGIRVIDLEAAMEELGTDLGVTWCPGPGAGPAALDARGGAITTRPLRFTYSAEGPLHLELLQGQPGTIWDAGAGAGLHHTGVWTDDIKGDTTPPSTRAGRWSARSCRPRRASAP